MSQPEVITTSQTTQFSEYEIAWNKWLGRIRREPTPAEDAAFKAGFFAALRGPSR